MIMKKTAHLIWALSVLSTTAIIHGQINPPEISIAVGLRSAINVEIINQIPEKHLAQLPKALPVFRYSGKPRNFPLTGLQMLLDQSVFKGTNIANLLHSRTNINLVQDSIRLTSRDNLDQFIVNPSAASISIRNAERKGFVPPPDAVPRFDTIQKQALRLTEMLGVSTNDMQRATNGSIFTTSGDEKTTKWGAAAPTTYVSSRRVTIPRGIEGCSTWLFNDKIELELGIDGRLLKFDLKWPVIEPVRTNRLFTISEIINKIKKGQTSTDVTEYSEGGLTQIKLKDIEIQYYFPESSSLVRATPTNTDIYPIIAILATFKSKTEEIDGGIYLSTLE